eukprot:scaffold7817_cov15-Tisochrysis_lutea.AAC.1
MLDPTLSGTVQKGLTNLLLVHRDTWNDRVTCSHVHSWSQPRSRALEVGDPLKDTSGPSLNILIKLMAVESLVFAPFFTNCAGGQGLFFHFFGL